MNSNIYFIIAENKHANICVIPRKQKYIDKHIYSSLFYSGSASRLELDLTSLPDLVYIRVRPAPRNPSFEDRS